MTLRASGPATPLPLPPFSTMTATAMLWRVCRRECNEQRVVAHPLCQFFFVVGRVLRHREYLGRATFAGDAPRRIAANRPGGAFRVAHDAAHRRDDLVPACRLRRPLAVPAPSAAVPRWHRISDRECPARVTVDSVCRALRWLQWPARVAAALSAGSPGRCP